MTEKLTPDVEVRWDLNYVPAGEVSERGLLIRVIAPRLKDGTAVKKPLNLALVIDASGSMRGARLHAAKQAVTGIIETLSDGDRVSVISFAQDVRTHVDGASISSVNRAIIKHDIDSIRSRGTTDLGSGWMAGAAAAANLIEENEFQNGNVVILSDGKANRGMTDPVALSHHSAELLARGITTSCVGIGDDYSPIQIDAIAEAGGGRLHDCATEGEIIEVLLGEIGAMRETVASSVELELKYASGTKTEVLTRLPSTHENNHIHLHLGALGFGGTRDSTFLVEVTPCSAGEVIRFEYKVSWTNPETGEQHSLPWLATLLTVVDPLEYLDRIGARDLTIAHKIAVLWRSGLVYESVRLNEAGQFHEAGNIIERNLPRMRRFVNGLKDSDELLRKMSRQYETVRKPWHDKRAKRDSFVSAKKMMKSEPDFRSRTSNARQDLESWRPDDGRDQSGRL